LLTLTPPSRGLLVFNNPGVKFVLVSVPGCQSADPALRGIYEVYADNLRDPFYASEMPIRSESFDKKVAAVVKNWS